MIPRKTTWKRVLEKLQEWRTLKGFERFWRQVLFRSRIEITGFKSFVPSPRHVRRATTEIVVHFTNFCEPEKTFFGFRTDLVSCVKAVAFLSLKTTELQGLRVDIWGDSCEIGGVEVTRLAFRLLDVKCTVN